MKQTVYQVEYNVPELGEDGDSCSEFSEWSDVKAFIKRHPDYEFQIVKQYIITEYKIEEFLQ